jgi:hypothetical protein
VVQVTRSFDGTRILTMACITAVSDAVVRAHACDVPSAFSLHYAGTAPGPIAPFGIDVGYLVVESEFLQLNSPELNTALTQVLDYFTQMRNVVADDHMIFCFEQRMTFGQAEMALLQQVCLQGAYERAPAMLPHYLTGKDPVFLEDFPELGFFRDVVFLFKALQAPTVDALPLVRPWLVKDAILRWTFEPKKEKDKKEPPSDLPEGQFVVHGFRQKLECGNYVPAGQAEQRKKKGFAARLHFKLFGGGAEKPRCPPSGANPSILAGEPVDTEDDVLHIQVGLGFRVLN